MVTPTVTGKTGADGVFHAVMRCCIIVRKYRSKFLAVIVLAEAAAAITSAQAATITAFLNLLDDLCVAMEALAEFSGVIA